MPRGKKSRIYWVPLFIEFVEILDGHHLGQNERKILTFVFIVTQPVIYLRSGSVFPRDNFLAFEFFWVWIILAIPMFTVDENQPVGRRYRIPIFIEKFFQIPSLVRRGLGQLEGSLC